MWSGISNPGALSPTVTGLTACWGRWERHWECHIEPDWLLIWHCSDNELILTRTGTHADLFG